MTRALVVVAALAAGCNLQRFTVGVTAPVLERGMRAMDREGDLETARVAAPSQLKTAEGMLETDPDNEVLLRLLARGYLELSFGFVEDELESTPGDARHADERMALTARATSLYERAIFYAFRRLDRVHRGFERAFERGGGELDAALRALPPSAAPLLTYAGMALAEIASLNRSDLSRVAELPKAVALLEAARRLDPRCYHGGAAMALALVYGTESRSLGGQPERARRYFDEAIAVDGGRYLMARVMMARGWAVAVHDRARFERTLRDVLATPPEAAPDFRLANTLARRRAARYLLHAADWF